MLILNIISLQNKYGKNMNLKKALNKINIKADWIGLREVDETTTYRVIRDNTDVIPSVFARVIGMKLRKIRLEKNR